MSHTKAPHKAGLSSPPSSGAGHPVLRSYIFELADKATLLTDSGATVVLNKGSTPSVVGSWDSFAKPSPMTFSEVRGSFGAKVLLADGAVYQYKFKDGAAWATDPTLMAIKDAKGNVNHEIKTHPLAEGHGAMPAHGTMPLLEAVAREKAGHVAIMHEVEAHHHFHAPPPSVSAGVSAGPGPHAPFERARAVGGHPGAASPAPPPAAVTGAGASGGTHTGAGGRPAAGAALRS